MYNALKKNVRKADIRKQIKMTGMSIINCNYYCAAAMYSRKIMHKSL